jgi:hypothetical protein
MFSPPGFDEFLRVTAAPAPNNAAVPAESIPVAVRNVCEVAADYGIFFGEGETRIYRADPQDASPTFLNLK